MTASSNALLTAQHEAMEEGITGLVDGSGSRAGFRAAVKLLRKHIYVEEVLLFPVIHEDSKRWMALAQMESEHGDMWPHIERALALLAAGAPLEDMLAAAEAMAGMLREHDAKEERAIYSAAERYDARPGSRPLADSFTSMELPAGWRCRRAPGAAGAHPPAPA